MMTAIQKQFACIGRGCTFVYWLCAADPCPAGAAGRNFSNSHNCHWPCGARISCLTCFSGGGTTIVYSMGGWPAPWGIELVAGSAAVLILLMIAIVVMPIALFLPITCPTRWVLLIEQYGFIHFICSLPELWPVWP